MKLCYHPILICFPPRLLVIIFVEIVLWSFNKLRDHMSYMNDIKKNNKWHIINLMTCNNGTILFSYLFQPSLVIVTFVKVVIQYLQFATWSSDQISCHPVVAYHFILPTKFDLYIFLWTFFLKLKIGNTKSGSY